MNTNNKQLANYIYELISNNLFEVTENQIPKHLTFEFILYSPYKIYDFYEENDRELRFNKENFILNTQPLFDTLINVLKEREREYVYTGAITEEGLKMQRNNPIENNPNFRLAL